MHPQEKKRVLRLYRVVSEVILDDSRLILTLKQGLLYSNLQYSWNFLGVEAPYHRIEPWYVWQDRTKGGPMGHPAEHP